MPNGSEKFGSVRNDNARQKKETAAMHRNLINQKNPRRPSAPKAMHLPAHETLMTRSEATGAHQTVAAAGNKNTGSYIAGCYTHQHNGATSASKLSKTHPLQCRSPQRHVQRPGRPCHVPGTPAHRSTAERPARRPQPHRRHSGKRGRHHPAGPAYRPAPGRVTGAVYVAGAPATMNEQFARHTAKRAISAACSARRRQAIGLMGFMRSGPFRSHYGFSSAARPLHAGKGQLRPDFLPVVRPQVLAGNFARRSNLDCRAHLNRHTAFSVAPEAHSLSRNAQQRSHLRWPPDDFNGSLDFIHAFILHL